MTDPWYAKVSSSCKLFPAQVLAKHSGRRDSLADKPKWKGFEELVARIQADLAGDASVTLNDKIIGKSGVVRQIDLSIKKRLDNSIYS